MRAAQVAVLGALAWRFPSLRPELDEHLADDGGRGLGSPAHVRIRAVAERALDLRSHRSRRPSSLWKTRTETAAMTCSS